MNAAAFLFAGVVILLSGCSTNADNEPPQQATAAHVPLRIEISNIAESACTNAWGVIALSRQLDGTSVGMCQLANGRRCGEDALTSGSCRL
ncbi:DUF333 domain-containing protein [Erwinia tracheiphila]|uniref:DUF333 domain-containing protein n=1 Tax=Erwinia tracheiphila TaxID=65700 RepID=A0A0M2K5L8_9GAMM|nr:DUF333 domain-containing protein [Erwinia tracheiphila]AXF75888.1 DUF333 domain-containing protein [Erwinia tracheiphila]EOS96899.1 hypothetical protein ETR_00330 [Erwinia tracheiphila PSU-1]KKF34675.1 hemolysin [Erwinia tracheiphila]UIA85448.1 DUF333 domain-containing protein [Erwinia tracheiphila]UIA86345.1 DUF333 domain-containing protein [Erwinia tracheiphila]